MNLLLRVLTLTLCATHVWSASECVHRDYGNGGTVCVCNATHCDTIPHMGDIAEGEFVYYTSSKAGQRFDLARASFTTTPPLQTGVQLQVNTSTEFQSILGFGAAFTDAAGINIGSLSAPVQEFILRSYFSKDGNEYNFGRVPIGGCDFSTRPYTYDDLEDNSTDPNLLHFKLAEEDFKYKIPLIHRAQQMSERPINLLAAAWSAPPWMKTNNDYVGVGFLKEEYYRAWANYHIKFLDEYQNNNLTFWGFSTGNEPLNGVVPVVAFNSLGWTPLTQQTWITQYLGPMVRNSSHSQAKILVLDDQRFFLPWWPKQLINEEVYNLIDGIAVHWYWDTLVPPKLLDFTHNAFPGKFLLATEACIGDKPWDKEVVLGSWARGEMYAHDIMDDLEHWVSGWIDWNLALDEQGGPNWVSNFVDATIIVNKTADEFYKQPTHYVLGHFSKFITPGAVRIDVQPRSDDVRALAFKTLNNSIVVILYNKKNADVSVTISGEPGYATVTVPQRSIVSLVYGG